MLYRLDLPVALRTPGGEVNTTAHHYPTERFWDAEPDEMQDHHLRAWRGEPCHNTSMLPKYEVRHRMPWDLMPDKFEEYVDSCSHFARSMRRRSASGSERERISEFGEQLEGAESVPCKYDPADPRGTVALSRRLFVPDRSLVGIRSELYFASFLGVPPLTVITLSLCVYALCGCGCVCK